MMALPAGTAGVQASSSLRNAVPFLQATGSGAPRACRRAQRVQCKASSEDAGLELSRRTVLGASLAVTAASQLQFPQQAAAGKVVSREWEQVDLPLDPAIVLLDIGFTGSDPNHGFLLGTRQTLLETFDGGKTWAPRTVEAAQDEGFNYRFNSISFAGDEGFIVGKPAILLHTADGGKSWERVPLSAKLPGTPLLVTALGNGKAEMTTDQGAIYATDNAAFTWTAAVQETVDATLNRTVSSGISGASYYEGFFSTVHRSNDGDYVAVSSRGNFYMTWSPGQSYWQPHNRPGARRVQNMGFTGEDKLWVSTRGGDVLLGEEAGIQEKFVPMKMGARGFGILDIGFRTPEEGFACGGSGTLLRSVDGGKSWKRDRSTDDIAGNLYAVKFFSPNQGFVLGNAGILLKYIPSSA